MQDFGETCKLGVKEWGTREHCTHVYVMVFVQLLLGYVLSCVCIVFMVKKISL